MNEEFDRVAEALVSATSKQSPENQRDTEEAIIAILEEKRAEVMVNDQAHYSIHEWQETERAVPARPGLEAGAPHEEQTSKQFS